jgi:alanine racemase
MSSLPDSRLTINLAAIVANWRWLAAQAAPARCGAAVKADAYGLGAVPVSRALARAGCTDFFVAHAAEGVALRGALPDARIFVLHGPTAENAALLRAFRLVPVVSTGSQVETWGYGPTALHVDTGMNRLGLEEDSFESIVRHPRFKTLDIQLVMSHLACADEPDHPMNAEQKAHFDRMRALLPGVPASLANSAGILLGADYRYDLVRPGIALYGADPLADDVDSPPRNLAQVVHLEAKILQVRHVDAGATVGYGATHRIGGPRRIATVPVGYADGFLRSLSNHATARIGDHDVPLVGRVSMDLITLDVTDVTDHLAKPGDWVTLLGGPLSLREAARNAGTIEYELLTRLGARLPRRYVGMPK